jgi:hypothetical protein
VRTLTDGAGQPLYPPTLVQFPGGPATGNVLEIFYQVGATHVPQLWAFLTNGFLRQVADGSAFATSYRLFRYFSSADEDRDELEPVGFEVLGIAADGRLEVSLDYRNEAPTAGDRFDVHCALRLDPPTRHTAMTVDLAITNSGGDVAPCCGGFHRILREQWVLFAFSTMYVADHLTGGLPPWYQDLDPDLAYVGNVEDHGYLNDGRSQNEPIPELSFVPTHDTARIALADRTVRLHHEIPPIEIPGYAWYRELVLVDEASRSVALEHLYDRSRDHRLLRFDASGLVASPAGLRWAATYNRLDPNLVDGENVQVKLVADAVLDTWPAGQSQELELRLVTGPATPVPALPGLWLPLAGALLLLAGGLALRASDRARGEAPLPSP